VYPSGMEVGPDGSVVLADTGNDAVKKYDSSGALQWTVTSLGGTSSQDSLENARDIGIDSENDIYVGHDANARIGKLDPNGNVLGTWTGPNGDKIGSPIGTTVTNDVVYVADGAKKKVRIFNTSGTQIRSFSSNGACVFSNLRDVDADADGNIYIANYLNNNVLKMTSTGTCITSWGTKGTGNGQFMNPYGVRIATD